MTGVTDMSDPIDQFKKIEEELPFVAITDDSDLHNQLNFFLSVCKNNLNDCNDVKVIFPMFYKLNDWQEFSTEFINPKIYLSRYQDGFNDLINEQLNISKQNIEYSFSRNLINIQNNGSNKFRYNIIISKGDSDEFTEENFTYIFKFKDLIKKENSIFESTLEIHTIINRTINNGVQYKSPIFQFNNNDFLKAMLTPSHMHTIYLKDNLKIYYIFSNCVSKYEKNFSLISTYGLGGIFVLMVDTYGAEKEKEKELIKVLERITDKVANRIVNYFHKSLITLHATRAAISQVMARNMSHNIGSHVLSKLIQWFQLHGILKTTEGWQYTEDYKQASSEKIFNDLQKVIEKLKQGCDLKDGCKEVSNCINTVIKLLNIQENRVFINYTLLATFFDYLKARMDYLADVTTNTPVIENILGIYNDIVKPCIQNRVLNDRISGINKFQYEIIVCKPNFDGTEAQHNGNGLQCDSLETKNCNNKINETNDVTLSIPNDVLGAHAFYTILENIIRNTAKHGNTPKDKNTEFKIKIEEAAIYQKKNKTTDGSIIIKETEELDWNEFYAISIFDNCNLSSDTTVKSDEYTGDNSVKFDKYRDKKINCVKKNENEEIVIKKIDKLVIDQNFFFNRSILENNQLRHGAWGLIEMDASAAYLRKIPNELIDTDKYQITCLQGENPVTAEGELAILQAYAEQQKYLGYRFFIRKPQEILIVGDDMDLGINQLNENNKLELLNKYKNAGVWIYNKTEFKSFFEDKKQKVFPHKLVVIVKEANDEINQVIKNNEACFSKRYFSLNNNLHLNNASKFKNELWSKYYSTINFKLYNGTVKGACSDHGNNYCEFVKAKHQFIEKKTSSTDHFFKPSIEPTYRYSWPIKIAVIDERIQSFTKETYKIEKHLQADHNNCDYHKFGVKYWELYRRTNIFTPKEDEANLNLQNFDSEYKKIVEFIKRCANNCKNNLEKFGNSLDDKPCEFIVVHMGIIEKLIASYNKAEKADFDKEDPESISKFIKKILLKNDGNGKYDSIIITSGRGKPHNLPKDIRYLNFSVISQYLITLRNKYAFTEALYSARKQN